MRKRSWAQHMPIGGGKQAGQATMALLERCSLKLCSDALWWRPKTRTTAGWSNERCCQRLNLLNGVMA